LVVGDLIKRFERRSPKITAYANDIGIIITGVCDRLEATNTNPAISL